MIIHTSSRKKYFLITRKLIWEDFIDDNEEKENGKRRSKKKAAKDFRVRMHLLTRGVETKANTCHQIKGSKLSYLAL
jgi:hypothetical protein